MGRRGALWISRIRFSRNHDDLSRPDTRGTPQRSSMRPGASQPQRLYFRMKRSCAMTAGAASGSDYLLRREPSSESGPRSTALLRWRFRDSAERDAKYNRPRNTIRPRNRKTPKAGNFSSSLESSASPFFGIRGWTVERLDDCLGVLAAESAPSQVPPGVPLDPSGHTGQHRQSLMSVPVHCEPSGHSTTTPQVGSAKRSRSGASLHIGVPPRGYPSPRFSALAATHLPARAGGSSLSFSPRHRLGICAGKGRGQK